MIHTQVAKPRAPLPPPPSDGIPVAVGALGSLPNLRVYDPRRMRAAAVALIGTATLLLVGFFSRAWFSNDIGLLGVDSVSWFDIPKAPLALKLFATAGIIGIAGAVAFLVHTAAMLFKLQPQKIKLVPLNASLGLAAFGCTSLFIHLAFGDFGSSPSYAGILTLATLVAASIVIGAVVRPLTRLSR